MQEGRRNKKKNEGKRMHSGNSLEAALWCILFLASSKSSPLDNWSDAKKKK